MSTVSSYLYFVYIFIFTEFDVNCNCRGLTEMYYPAVQFKATRRHQAVTLRKHFQSKAYDIIPSCQMFLICCFYVPEFIVCCKNRNKTMSQLSFLFLFLKKQSDPRGFYCYCCYYHYYDACLALLIIVKFMRTGLSPLCCFFYCTSQQLQIYSQLHIY